jgi:hypothetical protein
MRAERISRPETYKENIMNSEALHAAVTKLPLPIKGENVMETIRSATQYQEKLAGLVKQWADKLGEVYAYSYLPEARNLIFAAAWEKGQHLDYWAVEDAYIVLAESGELFRKR